MNTRRAAKLLTMSLNVTGELLVDIFRIGVLWVKKERASNRSSNHSAALALLMKFSISLRELKPMVFSVSMSVRITRTAV